MKSRFINIRVLTSIFIGLIAGILFCYFLFLHNFNNLMIVITSILLSVSTISLIFYAIITNKNNEKVKYRNGIGLLVILSSVGFAIFFIVGVLLSFFSLGNMSCLKSYSDYTISGSVCDYILDNNNYKKFILDDCFIVKDNNKIEIDKKICVYTYSNKKITLGDDIVFVSNLESFNFKLENEFDKLIQNIGYSTYVDDENIVVTDGNESIKDSIKNKVKNLLSDNFNEDNANITYAILFGEKQGLSDSIKEVFSYAGISHILAVSGLHIGVLVLFLNYLFSKLKMNDYIKLLLLFFILFFYSYLCSFSPSVLRASIMALMLIISRVLKVEYDSISSLSLSGIIILLFNPLSIFLISFQLSFLCVLSIISLAPSIIRFLKYIKIPSYLASALGISIATNILILPVCCNVFNYVSFLGVFVNIFVLPIFSMTYILLFLCVLICLILPFLSILFVIPNLFLHLIKVIANLSLNFDFLIFRLFNVGGIVLFLAVLTVLTLHFLIINKKIKVFIVSIMTVLTVFSFIYFNLPNKFENMTLMVYNQNDSNVVFLADKNSITMVGSDISEYGVMKQMKELKITHIDNIVAYDFELNNINDFKKLCKNVGVKNLYLDSSFKNESIIKSFNNVIFFDNNLNILNFNIKNIKYDYKSIGVYLNFNNKSILIPNFNLSKNEINYLNNNFKNLDILIIKNDDIKFKQLNSKLIVCLNDFDETNTNIFNLKNKYFYKMVKEN